MTTGVLKKCHETEFEVEVSWEIKKFLSPTSQSPKISPAFTWSSVDWELQMTCYSLKKIRLFLYTSVQRTSILSYLPSSIYEKHIPAIFKFGIRKSDGTTETRCILTKNFSYSENSFGTSEFILGAELEERKHQLLPEGILTLSCSIASLDTLNKPLNETYESLDDLSTDFKTLYGSTSNSDMTIVVGDQRYPVHKAILAARSDVFSAMFQNNMEEVKSGIVKISDCDPTSFEDFLLFLYTGKVENFSSGNFFQLHKIADKYNVQKLKFFCIKYMKRNLSVTNLLDVIILANQFDETDLMNLAQEYFHKNALEIMKGDDWEEFQKYHLTLSNQLIIKMLEKAKIED